MTPAAYSITLSIPAERRSFSAVGAAAGETGLGAATYCEGEGGEEGVREY